MIRRAISAVLLVIGTVAIYASELILARNRCPHCGSPTAGKHQCPHCGRLPS